MPDAIVVGGYATDRAEIISRMMAYGWRVVEHRMAGDTGHNYDHVPRNVKLVVTWRETLQEKQYTKACTMADVGRVPKVKWDIDRNKFRHRLEKLGLLYKPPEVPKVPETLEQVNGTPQEQVLLDYGDRIVEGIKIRSPIDDLKTLCELVKAELETNPLFKAVTVEVHDDGTATITPQARSFTLGEPVPKVLASTEDAPPAVVPPPPAPRPVAMPAQPRIDPDYKPIKPTSFEPKRDSRGRLLGSRASGVYDMQCRYPGCKARSKGPRNQFHCAAHVDLPMKEKHANMERYKEDKARAQSH